MLLFSRSLANHKSLKHSYFINFFTADKRCIQSSSLSFTDEKVPPVVRACLSRVASCATGDDVERGSAPVPLDRKCSALLTLLALQVPAEGPGQHCPDPVLCHPRHSCPEVGQQHPTTIHFSKDEAPPCCLRAILGDKSVSRQEKRGHAHVCTAHLCACVPD
jgi:hypothetical protein